MAFLQNSGDAVAKARHIRFAELRAELVQLSHLFLRFAVLCKLILRRSGVQPAAELDVLRKKPRKRSAQQLLIPRDLLPGRLIREQPPQILQRPERSLAVRGYPVLAVLQARKERLRTLQKRIAVLIILRVREQALICLAALFPAQLAPAQEHFRQRRLPQRSAVCFVGKVQKDVLPALERPDIGACGKNKDTDAVFPADLRDILDRMVGGKSGLHCQPGRQQRIDLRQQRQRAAVEAAILLQPEDQILFAPALQQNGGRVERRLKVGEFRLHLPRCGVEIGGARLVAECLDLLP